VTGEEVPSVKKYEEVLEKTHAAASETLKTYLASTNAADYYFLQYAFDGALSMYEAGGDDRWLDWVVTNSASIIARARPSLDGELGLPWRNPRDGSPNRLTGDNILCEFQIARPMLRAARLAARREGYAHAEEAKAVGRYVVDHVLAKWEDRRDGRAGGQRPEALADEPWVAAAEKAPEWACMLTKAGRPDHPWLDVWSMAGELYVRAYQLDGDDRSRRRAERLAELFKARRRVGPDGAWVWDEGTYAGVWGERGANTAGSPDTGHANREVSWVVAGADAGVGFADADLAALVKTLNSRLLQPGDKPRFANYVTGANTPYRGYVFAGTTASVSAVYDGWSRLSWTSPEARATFEALWRARRHGDEGHANATVWADLALPGHLARSIARRP
jgi:hypothetical protein